MDYVPRSPFSVSIIDVANMNCDRTQISGLAARVHKSPSTLDGFLLTHQYLVLYLASDHDVISARDCPAGKLRTHCAIACNEHSCGYSSSSFMTVCFIQWIARCLSSCLGRWVLASQVGGQTPFHVLV